MGFQAARFGAFWWNVFPMKLSNIKLSIVSIFYLMIKADNIKFTIWALTKERVERMRCLWVEFLVATHDDWPGPVVPAPVTPDTNVVYVWFWRRSSPGIHVGSPDKNVSWEASGVDDEIHTLGTSKYDAITLRDIFTPPPLLSYCVIIRRTSGWW